MLKTTTSSWFLALAAEVERLPAARSLIHGSAHWRAVAQTGVWLVERLPAADGLVVICFGLLHDAMRLDDGADPEHGPRAAELVTRLPVLNAGLGAERCEILRRACQEHSTGATTDDPTVGCCFDADRLQLIRLGRTVQHAFLSTGAAREIEAQEEAHSAYDSPKTWAAIATGLSLESVS